MARERFYFGEVSGAFSPQAGVWVRTVRVGSVPCLDSRIVRRLPTRLSGPVFLAPTVHGDERGFFLETYRQSSLAELGISDEFVQDNHSRSRKGIVRGMHFQPGMAKLVRCARGSIYDVLVDIRRGSPAFGQWEGFELDDSTHHQIYCPDGFAHGFCVLSEWADVVYMTSAYYDPKLESGFAYNDPGVAIGWPVGLELAASKRDSEAPPLGEIAATLPFEYRG
jgi:dTDP-4-dehydrorhamnose 3,5-epimerase